MNSFQKSGHPEKSQNHEVTPTKHHRYKSIKINQFEIKIRSNSSNLVLTRTIRIAENVLFSTLPVRGSEQARPITWIVDLDS